MDKTVLLVDDDEKLRTLLIEYLEGNGFTVRPLPDGRDVIDTIEKQGPDIVILDIMLPDTDGLDVLREVRKRFDLPVIMLTARGEETDRIVGLELGADDYLPKPFNPRELVARMRAVLRRIPEDTGTEPYGTGSREIRAGKMVLDRARRMLRIDEEDIPLSAAEFDLMDVLMSRPDTVLTRDQLMNQARGRDYMAFDRSIDVHISKLRAKLAVHPDSKDRIKTVWGSGYMFLSMP